LFVVARQEKIVSISAGSKVTTPDGYMISIVSCKARPSYQIPLADAPALQAWGGRKQAFFFRDRDRWASGVLLSISPLEHLAVLRMDAIDLAYPEARTATRPTCTPAVLSGLPDA